MKKLLFLMMALMVAPAMADVTFSYVDKVDGTVDIVVTVDGTDLNINLDSLVAGIALDVSVSAGDIVAVTNYKAENFPTDPAESLNGQEGYGIYMGSMTFTGGTPEEIATAGGPVAPVSANDAPGQLPGPECTLEFGCLFDTSDVDLTGAPLAVTTLCTIKVSEEATLTLVADAKRGGVVLLGGGIPSNTNLPYTGPTITGFACYTGPDVAAWEAVGSPESWCTLRQCHGDADDAEEVYGRSMVWVGLDDITILAAGFRQTGYTDPLTHPWIAADFDHAEEVYGRSMVRVGLDDITVLTAHFRQLSVPSDCQTATPVSP